MSEQEEIGIKFDSEKDPWHLIPWDALLEIVRVLGHGAKKYSEWNWVHVEPWRDRYFASTQRHLIAWWNGEDIDPDSGFHHLAGAGCGILFLLARSLKARGAK